MKVNFVDSPAEGKLEPSISSSDSVPESWSSSAYITKEKMKLSKINYSVTYDVWYEADIKMLIYSKPAIAIFSKSNQQIREIFLLMQAAHPLGTFDRFLAGYPLGKWQKSYWKRAFLCSELSKAQPFFTRMTFTEVKKITK